MSLKTMDNIGETNKIYKRISVLSMEICIALVVLYLICVDSGVDVLNFTFIEDKATQILLRFIAQVGLSSVLYLIIYNIVKFFYCKWWKCISNKEIWVRGTWLHIHVKKGSSEIRVGKVDIKQNFYTISAEGHNITPGDTKSRITDWGYISGKIINNPGFGTDLWGCYSAEVSDHDEKTAKEGIHQLRIISNTYKGKKTIPYKMEGTFEDTISTNEGTVFSDRGSLYFYRLNDKLEKDLYSGKEFNYKKLSTLHLNPQYKNEEYVKKLLEVLKNNKKTD